MLPSNGSITYNGTSINEESYRNILGYLPELYSTVSICLYFAIYGKWDGSTIAYNAGNYWGRVKELRNYKINNL